MPNIVKRTIRDIVAPSNPKQRLVTSDTPHNQDCVIADMSSSMSSRAFDNRSRYECLQEALAPYLGRVQVLAFNDRVLEVDADSLPGPSGMTAMEKAFKTATYLEPIHVLLISDGEPNNKNKAITEAKVLAENCIIDVMYIGPENLSAEEFMQEVAMIGRGRYFNFKIDSQSPALLETKIGSLLALPAPGAIEL